MSSTLLSYAVRLIAWSVLLGLALGIAQLPGDWGHGVCGAWGCGPPLQALIACHSAWLVVLLPAALWLRKGWPGSGSRTVGAALLLTAGVGLGWQAAEEFHVWWDVASPWRQGLFLRRVGFVVATRVELPLFELIPAGLLLLWPSVQRTNGPRPSATAGERFSEQNSAATTDPGPAGNPAHP